MSTLAQFNPSVGDFGSPVRRKVGPSRASGAQTPTTLGRTFPAVASPAAGTRAAQGAQDTPSALTESLPRITKSTRHGLVGAGAPTLTRSTSFAVQRSTSSPPSERPINLRTAWIERVDTKHTPKEAARALSAKASAAAPVEAAENDLDTSGFILSPDLRLQIMYGAEVKRIQPKDEEPQLPPPSPLLPKRVLQLGGGASPGGMFSPQSTSIGASPSKTSQFGQSRGSISAVRLLA